MPGYDGSIRIDSKISSKGFNQGMKGMTASLGKLAAAVGVAFGVAAIVNFGRSAVAAASELASAMTGLQSILDGQGRSFSEAQAFIQEYTADGLVPATNAIIAYKNLALRGYDTGQIETVMTALKDSAAFARTSSYTMGEAIAMASEGLKNENSILVDNAGVTRNVSMMWKDYAQSIGTTVAALTQQQKIQAEVNGILNETRFQTGDAARLSGGYAGMVAALGTSFYNLKVAVGNAIIPILAKIIPAITAAVNWFVVLFNTVARVINLIFQSDVGMISLEATSSAVADNTGTAADAAGDLADSTSDATKAAKGALAAFDELNVLQMDDAATDTGGAGAEVPALVETPVAEAAVEDSKLTKFLDDLAIKVAAFKEAMLTALQPTIDAIIRLKDALKPLKKFVAKGLEDFYNNFLVPVGDWVLGEGLPGFIDGLTNLAENIDWGAISGSLSDLWDALAPLAINVGEGLLWFWDNVLVPLGTWVANDLVPAFLDLLTAGADALTPAIDAMKPGVQWFFDNFLKPAAEWVGDKIIEALEWLTDALTRLSDWIKENQEVMEIIGIVLGSIATAVLIVAAALLIYNVVAGIAAAVTALLTSPIFLVVLAIGLLIAIVVLLIKYWPVIKEKALEVWEKIKEAWGKVAAWFDEKVIQPVKEWFAEAWEKIKKFFSDAWDKIKEVWNAVATWFQDNIITPLSNWFKEAWEDIKGFFSGAWDKIKEVWGVVATWFQEHIIDPIAAAWDTFTDNLKTAWENIWNGIKDIIKTVINTIIGFVNGLIQGVVNGINSIIRAINSLQIDIPEWVPVVGGQTWGLSINEVTAPQIPLLASGAVIPPNAEFLAMLGDQRSGRNIEAPEGLIRQLIREEMGSQQTDVRVSFEGTLGALVRELQPHITRETRRVGRSLVSGGVA